MAYSWNAREVLYLLGIKADRSEIKITCPNCGGRNFAMNTVKGIGRCFNCDFTADSASYYATTKGMSLDAARRQIEADLGIKTENGRTEYAKRPVLQNPEYNEAEKAPDDVLDRTYRAFLAELTLTLKNKDNLIKRGLDEPVIETLKYRTFPRLDEIDYKTLCRRLLTDGYTLKGVPGFYKDKKGDWTFIQLTKGIIMPQVNYKNQITSLQIRKDDDQRNFVEERGEYEAKCAWFSSKNRECGCTSSANVHYACDFEFKNGEYVPVFENGFILTEGIMKADIIHYLQPNCPVIAVPGVHALTHLEKELRRLKEMGVETILLCYDMDYLTNPNVQSALEKTKALIEGLGLRFKQRKWEVNVTVEGQTVPLKGLDDYLAYAKKKVIPEVKAK